MPRRIGGATFAHTVARRLSPAIAVPMSLRRGADQLFKTWGLQVGVLPALFPAAHRRVHLRLAWGSQLELTAWAHGGYSVSLNLSSDSWALPRCRSQSPAWTCVPYVSAAVSGGSIRVEAAVAADPLACRGLRALLLQPRSLLRTTHKHRR